jgi:Na+-driven multidrug efflux pump
MIYFDPLIMTPLTIVILPRIFGLDGIWITAVVTQFILNIVAFGMFASHEKQMRRLEAKEDAAADIAFAGKLQ